MDICKAKDCERSAFVYVDDWSTIGLCAFHWRVLWSRGGFYDPYGWQGAPIELEDGRWLRVEAEKYGILIEEPPYSGLQLERAA